MNTRHSSSYRTTTQRADDTTERAGDATERADDATERADDITGRADDITERAATATERAAIAMERADDETEGAAVTAECAAIATERAAIATERAAIANGGRSETATKHYQLAGHVILRYCAAHVVDPITAMLQVQEDLAGSRLVATEEEAMAVIGNWVRFRKGRTYRAGARGLYVCHGDKAITYIDNADRFKTKLVRGRLEISRTASLKPLLRTRSRRKPR
jgi:hypothetical protein